MLHALAVKAFYRFSTSDSCLEIEGKSASLTTQAPGLADSASALALDARHKTWADQLPKEPGDLWEVLVAFDGDSRQMLFAHCAALTLNAMHETWSRRPRAIAHADRLAQAVSLDMAGVGWRPTVDNYLGRVTKARILEAVREAKGEQAAQLIDHLKKPDMAKEAERLLAGTGWVPEPLRIAGGTVRSIPLRLCAAAIVLALASMPAHASGSSMPWEQPLQQILTSIEGPVAKIIAVIVIISTGISLAFGDTGGGFRKLLQITFGLSIAFAASSFFLSFFSFAGGVSL